jgi:hypothetical protein
MHERFLHTLRTFRKAAYAREWGTLQDSLAALISEMELFQALEIVVNRLQDYLPTFETYHPFESVKGRSLIGMIVQVTAFGFAPDMLPDEMPNNFDTPGSGQFALAVLEMNRAMQRDRAPAERPGLFTSAIANAILAELSELYYRRHPDDYARVRSNVLDPDTGAYTDPDAAQIPLALWRDPEVAARDVTLWLRVVDAVEAKLKEVA